MPQNRLEYVTRMHMSRSVRPRLGWAWVPLFCVFCTPQTNAVTLRASDIRSPAGVTRITRAGLDALSVSAGPLIAAALGASGMPFSVKVPASTTTLPLGPITATADVCPAALDASCTLQVDLAQAITHLDGVAPNVLGVSMEAPVRVLDVAFSIAAPLLPQSIVAHVGYGNGTCVAGKPSVTAVKRSIALQLPIVKDEHPGRAGLSRVDTARVTVDASGLSANDLVVCANCGAIDPGGVCQSLVSSPVAKAALLAAMQAALPAAIGPALDNALCIAPAATAPTCPEASHPNTVNTRCVLDDDASVCAQRPLGTAQRLPALPPSRTDLDGLFALSAALDPAPAAAADNTPYLGHTPNGITAAVAIGTRVKTVSPCVLASSPPAPAVLTLPTSMRSDTLPPGSVQNAHFAIALARSSVESAMYAAQQSGTLCRDVSSADNALLSTQALSVLLPSVKDLGRGGNSPLLMRARPVRPPHVTFPGDDAAALTMHASFEDFTVDLYAWIDARYERVMTFTADVDMDAGFETSTASGPTVKPRIKNLALARGRVTNAELLREEPAKIAAIFGGLVQTLAPQLLGSALPTLNLTDLAGPLAGVLKDFSLTKLHGTDDDYVLVTGHFGGGP